MHFLHSLFSKTAALFPNNIAVKINDESITYIELEQVSNRLSHYLLHKGVSQNDLVPIFLERSIEMIIS